ncbi:ISL3 family transposase [Streptacidiphilus anmyonensis]|uniref:ISL3 family transposase n=1 Tax=Streptacidiphilus anmyonensis TaxID=405782 RepID=UPI0005A6DAE6|nr:ISL3 family transposase [Streptacidiphilus anmyonensis]
MLFPHWAHVRVESVGVVGRTVRVRAGGRATSVACPACGTDSSRVHSRYERRPADASVGNQQTVLHLRIRRFFCDSGDCPRRTFAEQIPELTFRYGRCTILLRRIREAVALVLGGRPGARLTELQAVGLGRDAMIRLIRALPDPAVGTVRALGVDDFALRKGNHYGTILIDLETRRPVDVLTERSADALADWLTQHPGAEIICRDRASCYAEGANRTAGTATQVADRFHLWQNLADATERLVKRLRTEWTPPPVEKPAATMAEGQRARNIRELHAAVHALMDKGVRHSAIVADLRKDGKTIRKYMRAATPEELIGGGPTGGRRTLLDEHAGYLVSRFSEGCDSADLLQKELLQRGAKVSERTVRRFVHRLKADNAPGTKPPLPTAREVTTMVLTHPDRRGEDDLTTLKDLRDRCPDLDAAHRLIGRFADMLVNRTGREKLEPWVADAEASPLPELRRFATGLRRDWDAVMAGLSTEWSSGQVEGHVNRLKLIKRQMFGRGKPDLLRKRVLLQP